MIKDFLKEVRRDVEISGYTYFGLRGRVAYLVEVSSPSQLIQTILEVKKAKLSYFIMAGGSNIVMGDKKYPGVVIVYREKNDQPLIESIIQKNNRLVVWGSVSLEKVIKFSLEKGLAGLESLSGIPGNLSGAIYGNAGAYGHSISEAIEKVLIFDGRGERWLSKKDCRFSYRDSLFKKRKWVILSAQLKLKPGEAKKLQEYSDGLIAQRNKKYSNIKCPGSFFKNVLVSKTSKKSLARVNQSKIIDGKIPAGYLLEEIGAKGLKVGGLRIADYHGNLIINDGEATYRDVKKLVAILKERVKSKFGINLEEEVRIIF